MSRGTRGGYDVMGLMPEDQDPYRRPFPYLFSLPADQPHGTGRVGILNDQVVAQYNHIRDLGNEYYDDNRLSSKCSYLNTGKHWFTVSERHSKNADRVWTARDRACMKVMDMIGEIEALGHEAYIPHALQGLIRRPNVVPFGSMSYLTRRPHYYFPEEYAVPCTLPPGGETIVAVENIRTFGEVNSVLRRKYSAIMKHLNRMRFFRDCRVRQGALAGTELPHNDLTGQITSCRSEFEVAVRLIRRYQDSFNASKMFNMPDDLRDLVTFDSAVLTQQFLGEVGCLFPGGIHPFGAVEMFLLYESALGYAIFRVCTVEQNFGDACAAVLDWESLRQAVRLVVYYPFPSDVHALNQCHAISIGTMTAELRSILQLYLPDPVGWRRFHLGVLHPILANFIHEETKITCRCNSFVRELFRGIRQHFSRFVELEESEIEKAQLRLGHSYSMRPEAGDALTFDEQLD